MAWRADDEAASNQALRQLTSVALGYISISINRRDFPNVFGDCYLSNILERFTTAMTSSSRVGLKMNLLRTLRGGVVADKP